MPDACGLSRGLAGVLLLGRQLEDPGKVALVLGHVGDRLQRAGAPADLEVEEVLAQLTGLARELLDGEILEFLSLHGVAFAPSGRLFDPAPAAPPPGWSSLP